MRRKSRWNKSKNGPSLSYIKREKKFHMGIVYEIVQWIALVFIAVFIAVALNLAFGVRTAVVGESMEPTLQNGQEILLNRIAYQFMAPARGDIVVFRPNNNTNAHVSVKRVIAVPGDTVLITLGKVVINGVVYANDVADDTKDPGIAAEEITLGPDEYFVLGDNRNNSEDSRSANIGNISRGMIEGKAWYHLKSKKQEAGRIQ